MVPVEIILHHSGETDFPNDSWPAIRRYQMSYRIDRVIVTPMEYARRFAAVPREGSLFEVPWDEIAYNAGLELVGSDYVIQMGRPWDWIGAHTLGHNGKSLGFCFVGNFDLVAPEPARLAAAVPLLSFWMRHYNIPKDRILFHREVNQTDCPGTMFSKDMILALLP
jgi:hypothetical protein